MLMGDLDQLPSIPPGLFLFNIDNELLRGGQSNPIINLSKNCPYLPHLEMFFNRRHADYHNPAKKNVENCLTLIC
jgi:hypothetical protein